MGPGFRRECEYFVPLELRGLNPAQPLNAE
jgi:hypothetical protein